MSGLSGSESGLPEQAQAHFGNAPVAPPPARDDGQPATGVLTLGAIDTGAAATLLGRYGIGMELVANGAPIPGSYWGEPEAGVIGEKVYARRDTPVHSLLHEACHLIVAAPERRARIHTDASDSQAEEDACCYLQIVLGSALAGVGSARVMADMDAWGYTFRLGSARAWFERDADDAQAWLQARGLLEEQGWGLESRELRAEG